MHALSLFSFGRSRPLRINCACGFAKMAIFSLSHRHYLVHLGCIACSGTHQIRLGRKEFWGEEIHRFRCPKTGAELGCLGPERAILETIEAREEGIGGLGFPDYFTEPEVMLQVLGHLKFLAENENLACQCGNRHIEVDVFPDKLELRCISCHSLLIVYAETQEDLVAVRRMPRIVMSERGFASIDASRMTQER
ncbi:MAG: hypothetical protein K6U03_05225 [Firmicutes bacterium]|nr:hypothetical protein [Bacillota bacterium]